MGCQHEVDGIKHHLFLCIDSKNFWFKLKKHWMIANPSIGFKFAVFCILVYSVPEAETLIFFNINEKIVFE